MVHDATSKISKWGAELGILDDGLADASGNRVLKFANRFRESLEKLARAGFRMEKANVNFVVYWKDEEMRVVLPEVLMVRE